METEAEPEVRAMEMTWADKIEARGREKVLEAQSIRLDLPEPAARRRASFQGNGGGQA